MQVLDGQVTVEMADGRQQVRVSGGGSGSVRDLPDTFRVVSVEHDAGRVVLRADDGREVRVTPGQLATPGIMIPPELHPEHQAHLEGELFGLPTVPAPDADGSELTATLHDARLGAVVFDPVEGVSAYQVPTALGPVQVRFCSAGRERVEALLPITCWMLDYLPQLLAMAVEFLWQWGANGTDTRDDHEQFVDSFGVHRLSVYHCGAFSLELSDDQTVFAESFLDGYWPSIHFLPDGEPVFVTIEC
ncbi:MAG: hypothetical protein FWD18_10780 [Micrococcales bacterium]|nr:hypothetical protein [Micrococcales bacterium]